MGRRYQEIEETASHDVEGAKAILKRVGDRERAFILTWQAKYFSDEGALVSPPVGKARRTVVIDGAEFWLVKVPKRQPQQRR
jgi:S-adenosylmethionine hydrolase